MNRIPSVTGSGDFRICWTVFRTHAGALPSIVIVLSSTVTYGTLSMTGLQVVLSVIRRIHRGVDSKRIKEFVAFTQIAWFPSVISNYIILG